MAEHDRHRGPAASPDDQRLRLAEQARGDIPARYCTIVDVQIVGDAAHVWMITNEGPSVERYQVDFSWVDGVWEDGGGYGGFHGSTPAYVFARAERIERGDAVAPWS